MPELTDKNVFKRIDEFTELICVERDQKLTQLMTEELHAYEEFIGADNISLELTDKLLRARFRTNMEMEMLSAFLAIKGMARKELDNLDNDQENIVANIPQEN